MHLLFYLFSLLFLKGIISISKKGTIFIITIYDTKKRKNRTLHLNDC